MKQMEATQALLSKRGLDVTVAAISELKDGKPWMICSDSTVTVEGFKAALADPEAGKAGDFLEMADHLKSVAPHAVMFDTTASEIVSNMYAPWLIATGDKVDTIEGIFSGTLFYLFNVYG